MSDIDLSGDAAAALVRLREASLACPVVVFKFSPICPVSHAVEQHFRDWLSSLDDGAQPEVVFVDVIAQKPLARGLTSALDIQHESPQALWFAKGELHWHGSHHDIKGRTLTGLLQSD